MTTWYADCLIVSIIKLRFILLFVWFAVKKFYELIPVFRSNTSGIGIKSLVGTFPKSEIKDKKEECNARKISFLLEENNRLFYL